MVANISYTVKATIDSTVLNNLWTQWCVSHGINPMQRRLDYSRVSKRNLMLKEFEEWLYTEGATVARADKKCYLQFVDAEQATLFRLKYA